MSPGRILAFVFMLFIASVSSAAMLVDPFLEDLRVGTYSTVDEIEARDGWPADLFASPNWSPGWEQAWRRITETSVEAVSHHTRLGHYFHDGKNPHRDLALIRAWTKRDSLAGDISAFLPPLFAEDLYTKRVLDQAAVDPRAALHTIDVMLESLPTRQLDDLERFVWSLRRRALLERVGRPELNESLWPELIELGPYDKNSGWAIWTVKRLQMKQPLIPAMPADDATALFIAGLRSPGLTSRDIDRSPYSRGARMALGAAALPKSSLRRHFGMYPDPPAGARLQGHWLRGRWRMLGYSAVAAERLAHTGGIAPEHKAGYLRRAADKQASAGFWGSVVPNLRAAHLQAARSGKRSVIRRINTEIERMAALSAHQGNRQALELLTDIVSDTPAKQEPGRLGDLSAFVSAGHAPVLSGAYDYAGATSLRTGVWRAWAKLGLRLVENTGETDPRWQAYASILSEGTAARDKQGIAASAAKAIVEAMQAEPWFETILDWELISALGELSHGDLVAESTPIVQLVREADSDLETYLLLGIAIALQDARGQLAATVAMSRPGLSLDENLLLLYPIPASDALWSRLRASGIDPALVLAVARNESLFDPAVRSRSGALGWMQIMPFHYPGNGHHEGEVIWRSLGKSVEAGLKLLAQGIRRNDGDPYRTLADYNAGPTAVKRWDAQLGAETPAATFLSWIGYPETRRYVEKVLIDREVYAWILEDAATP